MVKITTLWCLRKKTVPWPLPFKRSWRSLSRATVASMDFHNWQSRKWETSLDLQLSNCCHQERGKGITTTTALDNYIPAQPPLWTATSHHYHCPGQLHPITTTTLDSYIPTQPPPWTATSQLQIETTDLQNQASKLAVSQLKIWKTEHSDQIIKM